MDWTPKSFLSSSSSSSSSPQIHPGNHIMFDNTPVYSSSSRSGPVNGLGIAHGEGGSPLGQLRLYPSTDSYTTLSAAGWSDRTMPPDSLQQQQRQRQQQQQRQEPALDVDPYYSSTTTSYDSYCGHNEISRSPLSLYGAQTLSASPSYSSGMEMGENHGALVGQPQQPLGFWSTTPRSEITTPPENFIQVKDEPEEYWDSSLYAEEGNSIEMSMMMSMPQVVVNDAFPDSRLFHGRQYLDHGIKQSIKQDHNHDHELSVVAEKPSTESASDTDRDNTKSPPASNPAATRSPAKSAHQCTICGACFTRRSNCREHMKRHDPSRKTTYQCELCSRTFGRRTDRKRHVESIHQGLRKFGCDQCGRRFTRHDTLSRHKADCCNRKGPIPPDNRQLN